MRPSLREIFTPLFSYVLLVAHVPFQPGRAFAEIRGAIKRLLEEQGKHSHDFSPGDYDTACFAVIAWIDELLLTTTVHADPALFDQWEDNPLQFERYGIRTAGEEFFVKVHQLGPTQREIKEIYHLCLCLGFLGEYNRESPELKKIRNELARDLVQQFPTPFLNQDDIQRRSDQLFTPQPYQVPPPPPSPVTGADRKPAALYVAAALTSLALLLIVFWFFSKEEGPAPPMEPPKTQPLPLPPPDGATVRERLTFFECALFTDINITSDGIVSLEGNVEDEERRGQVQQVVSQISGVTKAEVGSLVIVPKPFCEVLDILFPLQQQGRDLGYALQVRPHKGCNEIYRQKERLIVEITAEKPLQHTYVDYYTADKAAVTHLFPNPKQTDNLLRDATQLVLGRPGSKAQWDISPPSGLELVTVITTAQALFTNPQLEPEEVGRYLSNLRTALTDPVRETAAAAYCFITAE